MTTAASPAVDQRDCALYRFRVRHPVTGLPVLGYIGETVRMPFLRLMEHIAEQPWADTIIGWEVDDTVYVGKDAVLAAERAAILAERPLYNIRENMGNPDRIPPWTAVEQRQAREPGWQPQARPQVPRQRAASTPTSPARPRTPARRQWQPLRASDVVRVLGAALFAGWAWPVGASGPVATWTDGLWCAAALTAVLFGSPVAAVRDVRRAGRGVNRPRRGRGRR